MRTLLIILLIIVIWRTLVRYVFPALLMEFIKKNQDQFQQHERVNQRPEGEVKVEYIPNKPGTKSDGEYVDYEEIK